MSLGEDSGKMHWQWHHSSWHHHHAGAVISYSESFSIIPIVRHFELQARTCILPWHWHGVGYQIYYLIQIG